MRIRRIALCLGLGVTPGLAPAAHAQYHVTVLQDVGGLGINEPFAINDAGQSVGWSHSAGGVEAVLWSASGKAAVLQDVGSQGISIVKAINDAGQSVGYSVTTSGMDAVLWSPSGKATVLQDVGGRGFSYADAINDAGWSVGGSCTASNCFGEDAGEDAVLWSPSGKATDLGAVLGPAWSWTEAVGINNSGDIIGYGIYHGGQYGFLLTSVPEPSTWAMLLAGFAGLGFAGYRRAKTGHATLAA